MPGGSSHPRVGALDGLRGTAVAAVVAFHTEATWARGGYLGVSLFFTLSGFLITGVLQRQVDDDGTVHLGRFWTRRFRRLWPAAIVTIAGIWVANAVVGQFDVNDLAGDSLAAILNVANWNFLRAGTSYQDLFEAPSPLLHFWSLAIEEQFYLFFPLVFAMANRGGRRGVRAVVGVLFALSVASQFLAGSADRVYLSTDTRAGEILFGSLIALWFTPIAATPLTALQTATRRAAIPVALGTLAAWSAIPKDSSLWEHGGLVAVSVSSGLLILGASAGGGPFAAAMELAPLRWLGTRSYAIYLFHWPIFVMWRPRSSGWTQVAAWIPRLVLVALLAEASYRLVEMPIRRERLLARRWWPTVTTVSSATIVALVAVLLTTSAPVDRFELEAEPAPFVPPPAPTSTQPDAPGDAPADPAPDATPPAPAPPKLAIVGDSTARAAADGLVEWSRETGAAWVYDLSRPSCPISEYLRYRQSPNEPANDRNPECEWRGRFGEWLAEYDPDLVAVIGGTSEVVDFDAPGVGWTNIGEPEGYDFVRSEFVELITEIRAAAPHARVVATTAPYNDWLMCAAPCLTHDRSRFDRYNEMIDDLHRDGIIDGIIGYGDHINDMDLAPTDPFRPDGVHLSENGSRSDAEAWLGPELLAAA